MHQHKPLPPFLLMRSMRRPRQAQSASFDPYSVTSLTTNLSTSTCLPRDSSPYFEQYLKLISRWGATWKRAMRIGIVIGGCNRNPGVSKLTPVSLCYSDTASDAAGIL